MRATNQLEAIYEFNEPRLKALELNEIRPKKRGNIPELAVLLGLISPKFYEIYNHCDGKSAAEIADAMSIDETEIRVNLDKLFKNKMILL